MLKKLRAILRAHRTEGELKGLRDRVGDLKKKSEKTLAKAKSAAEKLSETRRDLGAVRAQGHILTREIESLKVLTGKLAADKSRALPIGTPLQEAEFQVFSQWGEDGIIQFLLAHVPVAEKVFVEFGVESYAEANTRFLLLNDYWTGLILDGSEAHMQAVADSDLAWRHSLKSRAAWVDADNIDGLITDAGISGDIGILSVDIDGMDYHVWKAITSVQPRIVIAEYNSLFGPSAKVTLPYDPKFERAKAHSSHVLYGVSIAALDSLAKEKGYRLIGTNTAGNNVFFVRDDLAGGFPERTPEDAFQQACFQEARSPAGELLFPTFAETQQLIAGVTVLDLEKGVECPLAKAAGWSVLD